ncbi:MAG: nuclear transport factor 2 family protein [Planctomycetes bacterium]|nr:nuclear transport factor 2 family protein [Planctomycetota bacterium]MBL7037182.1 nuclear transport factor 2 family protein [Pirellulaceae bacterium]
MAAFDLISEFALSLDAEDYQSVLSYLADDCVYESPTGVVTGPAAIVDSYKANGDSARSRFDRIEYRHQAIPLGEGWFRITFIDELVSGQRVHLFRCNQRVFVENGQIVRIVHEEIPGQRDRLNAFMRGLD